LRRPRGARRAAFQLEKSLKTPRFPVNVPFPIAAVKPRLFRSFASDPG